MLTWHNHNTEMESWPRRTTEVPARGQHPRLQGFLSSHRWLRVSLCPKHIGTHGALQEQKSLLKASSWRQAKEMRILTCWWHPALRPARSGQVQLFPAAGASKSPPGWKHQAQASFPHDQCDAFLNGSILPRDRQRWWFAFHFRYIITAVAQLLAHQTFISPSASKKRYPPLADKGTL